MYSKRHSNSDVPCCRCCGENSFIEFLTIDHIEGRTHLPKEQKDLTGNHLVSWLTRNNCPEGFQILCWNCNVAKGDKECPHLEMKKMSQTDEERKAKSKEYESRPEVKAKRKEYESRPEVKAKRKERCSKSPK